MYNNIHKYKTGTPSIVQFDQRLFHKSFDTLLISISTNSQSARSLTLINVHSRTIAGTKKQLQSLNFFIFYRTLTDDTHYYVQTIVLDRMYKMDSDLLQSLPRSCSDTLVLEGIVFMELTHPQLSTSISPAVATKLVKPDAIIITARDLNTTHILLVSLAGS